VTPNQACACSERASRCPPSRPRATARDVADAIGCDLDDVSEALGAGDAYAPRTLDAPVRTDEGEGITGVALLPDDGRAIAGCEDAAALELARWRR
jgi:hypothetical protein